MVLPFKVSKTHLELQDYVVNLDTITEQNILTPFKLEQLPSSTQELRKGIQMELTFELNLDLAVIQRVGYTLIDLLSDIGGVQAILVTLISMFVWLCNYNNFDNHMASQLFKTHKEDSGKNSGEFELFSPTKFFNLKELAIDKCACCCRRRSTCHKRGICRKTVKERMIEAARNRLVQEVSIIDIIKSRRYFHMALRHMLP